ncbi:acyl-CoA thioesterase [Herbaspirillum lusitanum]|jgi:acyl-CoA thioester hydrolase|uniref:acyl-CoA thioesterase n=1 Tax=Herbaspirillum lusitanum TaxID=213312 RepID=UPI000309C7B6|nr:thioesterase family protein [Herbaspirillum lusitanum]MCW5299890.1 acyl-CoA thioesterase [Herbaspirillum lusitanum]
MTDKILIHTSRMDVRWGDMDAFNHVNNTVYFRYMEQTRIEWLETIGVGLAADGLGPVIVNAHCSFLRQLKYPADIEIRMYAQPPGRSSVETTYEIRRVDQPEIIYAEGGAKIVWVNFKQEKSVPLPESIRQTLTGL